MTLIPITEANEAKLMSATAGHVVASLCFLDKCLAFWTSFPLVKIILEVLITGTFVMVHHTLFAEFFLTFSTFWRLNSKIYQSSYTFLAGA